jgi:Lipocalin-like domain
MTDDVGSIVDSIVGSIVGTWRLVETKAHDDTGKTLPRPYGPQPMGLVTFQADGRMMAVLCDGRASLPSEEPRQFMSYAGNYRFDGSTLVTKVDASSDASRIGGEQVRQVRFERGRMLLNPPRRLFAGMMQHQELAWERVV